MRPSAHRQNPLRSAAEILGLAYEAPSSGVADDDPDGFRALRWGGHAFGTEDGLRVRVGARVARRQFIVLYGVRYPASGLRLRIKKANSAIIPSGRRFDCGSSDSQDEVALSVKAEDQEFAQQLQATERCEPLVALARRLPNFVIRDGLLDASERRSTSQLPTPQEIVENVELCKAAARSIVGPAN